MDGERARTGLWPVHAASSPMAARIERLALAQLVASALAPYIGPAVARAAVSGHCDSLGFGSEVGHEDVTRLLDRVGPAMVVFVGRQTTTKVLEEIAQAVRALGVGT